MKQLILILTLSLTSIYSINAAETKKTSSLKKEFQTLGDNEEVLDRVKKMDSQQKIRIVQNRLVDRNNRLELALNYGSIFETDSYVKSSELGARLEYHISPRWSFGVEYQKNYNSLTSEGQRVYDNAYACQQSSNCTERFPGIDFPLETQVASISFYPIYGKLNLFDSGIAQFDIYTSLGYGNKKLNSGDSNVFLANLGVGIWLNNLFTTRFELRYENYKDLLNINERNQNAFTALASVGILIW
jgi:outer membrane immunogenic protein